MRSLLPKSRPPALHGRSLIPRGLLRQSGLKSFAQIEATGLKGFEPLTYRCPSDVPMERADKSRSLYLAKLQARGGVYWPSSVKRCAGARAPFKKAHGLTDVELEYLQAVATCRRRGDPRKIPPDPPGVCGSA